MLMMMMIISHFVIVYRWHKHTLRYRHFPLVINLWWSNLASTIDLLRLFFILRSFIGSQKSHLHRCLVSILSPRCPQHTILLPQLNDPSRPKIRSRHTIYSCIYKHRTILPFSSLLYNSSSRAGERKPTMSSYNPRLVRVQASIMGFNRHFFGLCFWFVTILFSTLFALPHAHTCTLDLPTRCRLYTRPEEFQTSTKINNKILLFFCLATFWGKEWEFAQWQTLCVTILHTHTHTHAHEDDEWRWQWHPNGKVVPSWDIPPMTYIIFHHVIHCDCHPKTTEYFFVDDDPLIPMVSVANRLSFSF